MKNLANCTPREFIAQTNKIRKSVANWIKATNITEIRKRVPDIAVDADAEERKKAYNEQGKKNLNAILDEALEKHPDETIELLGLMCFIEPNDLDNHSMKELFGSFSELMNCDEVINFFGSLLRLAN